MEVEDTDKTNEQALTVQIYMQHPVCFSALSTDTLAEILGGLLDSRITDRRDSLHVKRSQREHCLLTNQFFQNRAYTFSIHFHKNTQLTSVQLFESQRNQTVWT